jgi:serine/threonine-protein kinase
LLAGDAYFRDESASGTALYSVVTRILAGADEPPSARALRRAGVRLPPAFDAWFLKATALRSEARFDRASTQVAALADALGPAARQPLVPFPPPPHPKGSRAILLALLGVGALLIVAVVLFAGSRLGVPGLGGSASCMPGAICASIDVPDPAHVDPQAILPAVHRIARSIDGHAALTMISVTDVARDGTTDVSGEHGITYEFAIPGAALSVTVRKKLAIAMKSAAIQMPTAAEPRCSMRAAWKAAAAAGMPAGTLGNVTYSHVAMLGGSVWTVSTVAGTRSWIIDGQTCAHRKP